MHFCSRGLKIRHTNEKSISLVQVVAHSPVLNLIFLSVLSPVQVIYSLLLMTWLAYFQRLDCSLYIMHWKMCDWSSSSSSSSSSSLSSSSSALPTPGCSALQAFSVALSYFHNNITTETGRLNSQMQLTVDLGAKRERLRSRGSLPMFTLLSICWSIKCSNLKASWSLPLTALSSTEYL